MIDRPESETEAVATAAADLGDRFARHPAHHAEADRRPRLVPRTGDHIDRRDLTNRDEIVERMARDILAARRDGQHGHLIDLTASGWTQAQAMRWGSQAHAAAADPRIATQDVVERLAADEGAHTVALASIDVERIVAGGEAAVAEALGEITDDFGGAAA